MPPASMDVSPVEFFKLLWGDTVGYAELTAISKNGVKSFPFKVPDSLKSILPASVNHNKSANVYMGVLLRKEPWPRDTGKVDASGKALIEYRGTEVNAQTSWCVWFECDFAEQGHKGRTIPEEEAKKKLREFPLKPSVIVKSGGGIQGYFLLKEPAEGKDLWRVKAINKALVLYLGADPQSVDLARILRIPGSMNLKYTPPRKVEISWWKPENRYTLEDFEEILPTESPLLLQGQSPSAGAGPGELKGRPIPSTDLTEEQVAILATALADLWIHGHKHESALHVAGMLAWAGIREDKAKAIIEGASNSVKGDTPARLKDVESTYRNYQLGKPVTGRKAFDEMSTAYAYPQQQAAAFFREAFEKIMSSVEVPREAPKPNAPPIPAPDIEKLPISDYGKKIIKEGHPGYIEFLKNTETPSKFRQLKAEGKMTRTEADCYIVTLLLQAGISEQAISAIFQHSAYKISSKAIEKDEKGEEYIGSLIRECQGALRAQPKWLSASIARAASNKVDRVFEDEHLRILKVTKYVQEPPTYDVRIVLEGIDYVIRCSLDQVWEFKTFAKAFFAKFNRHLPFQKDSTWARMYAAAETETVEVEVEEGTFEGQMGVILNLLEETAVDMKSGGISINHTAVRLDEGGIIFKTPVILRILKDRWVEAKKQEVTHYLKQNNWDYKPKRFGPNKVDWVWILKNGSSSNGNGHKPTPPKDPVKPATEDHTASDMLFELDPTPDTPKGTVDDPQF